MNFSAARRVTRSNTNLLEQLNGEIKRRINIIGVFPNEASAIWLIGVLSIIDPRQQLGVLGMIIRGIERQASLHHPD